MVAVNWTDVDTLKVQFDLIKYNVAFTKYDRCIIQDMWDETIEDVIVKGDYNEWGTLEPNQNMAKRINCSPI